MFVNYEEDTTATSGQAKTWLKTALEKTQENDRTVTCSCWLKTQGRKWVEVPKKSFPFTKCLERKYIKRDHKHLRDTF